MSNTKRIPLRQYLQAYSLPVFWASVIFFLSNQEVLPGFSISAHDFIFKKTAHMFMYAVLYFLFHRAHQQTQAHLSQSTKTLLIPLILTMSYAILDELHQSMIPGRYPTWRDVGYDLLGATTVLLHQLKLL